ncbi:MAG: type IV pilus twitching motility protein PilT [Planctomycetota bacterium]|jgi:twitching motility protein PilT
MSTSLTKLLALVVKEDASDLHLAVGQPPIVRIGGQIRRLKLDPLTSEDIENYMREISSERCQNELAKMGGSDFAFTYGDQARFRTSIFRQRGYVGIVLRLIPSKIWSYEDIGLPEPVRGYAGRPRGLFLVTGPTGSGKTTTLATMVDDINRHRACHILTVEDPIEYYHESARSLITQREVGVDVPDFAEAIKRGLRQDPDVILVGEMRDLETISTAITAAETGHLVLATLHTTGSARTINRIIDVFPREQQSQVRVQLSVTLLAVLSQVLLPRADGKGRVAGFEFMVNTPGIANMIRENRTYQIPSAIQTGRRHGMLLLDDYLFELFEAGIIDIDTYFGACQDPTSVAMKLREAGFEIPEEYEPELAVQ